MNLTQALNVALPDIPARLIAQRCPRLHPQVVHQEHIVDGRPTVRIYVPGVDAVFNLAPQTWDLVRFFDGQRSYEEVEEAYSREIGIHVSLEELHELADDLESIEFWYKTPQEKNIAVLQQSADQRRNALKKKSRWGDLGFVTFPAFNPDTFLVWLDGKVGFIFTWWFTLLTLGAFAVTLAIFLLHWSEVSRDTLQFFNFADKTWLDLVVFWGITFVLAAIHEAAHGVTCRHFGAPVTSMGFALIYLTPAFFTDTTQGVVRCPPWERILISVAGVWSELYLCTIATVVWWGTPPGTAVHDIAYLLMLMTGIATVLLNWNPLMKLDGYHILCDVLGILDLKENSTAYVSAWVKKHVWRLPVEVPYVPKRRRLGFAFYAIASGLYSYTVLYILARFVGNVFRNFNPEWSFVPELATGALIFRSRIRSLVNFMKFVYLDKKDRVRGWFQSPQRRWAMVGVGALLLLPLWHESIGGRFVLEAADRAVIRAQVPGMVTNVYTDEGQVVSPGAVIAQLRNLSLTSKLARTEADYRTASAEFNAAESNYTDTGAAQARRDQLAQQTRLLTAEAASLELKSPMSGIVTTPRIADRLGRFVTQGTELAEVADIRAMRARIYVSEYDMHKYRGDSRGRLQVDGILGKWDAGKVQVSAASAEIAPGLIDLSKFKGMRQPTFYEMDLWVSNPDRRLKPGMVGTARVYGQRRSLAGFAYRDIAEFLGRKVW
ncbi:MAG: efflux RND transporter periplasmic adaptor subunit [Terriglobales bacterium]